MKTKFIAIGLLSVVMATTVAFADTSATGSSTTTTTTTTTPDANAPATSAPAMGDNSAPAATTSGAATTMSQ